MRTVLAYAASMFVATGAMAQSMPMKMAPMQGGQPASDARDPDYSDGVPMSPMRGMDMNDGAPIGMLLIDQLETTSGHNGSGKAWDIKGWYGNDTNRLWLRSEGEGTSHALREGNVEALWYHTVAAYWGTQLGIRQDVGQGEHRRWAAFGIQGLAPYWFELQATAYVGEQGRTAMRFRAEYELLFTQRLVLQPELEMNFYGKPDRQERTGAGLSDVQFGLRLRYEIRRWFAPYVGVQWRQRVGGSAGYARADGEPVFDRQWVAGLRVWF